MTLKFIASSSTMYYGIHSSISKKNRLSITNDQQPKISSPHKKHIIKYTPHMQNKKYEKTIIKGKNKGRKQMEISSLKNV